MGFFSGLEKFGLDTSKLSDIFATEDEAQKKNARKQAEQKVEVIPKESDFLLEKNFTCPICDKKFKSRMVKTGKARRLKPDKDLRPHFQYIDTLKYDVVSCPHCGYSALHRNFQQITPRQRKMVKEQICANFKTDGKGVNELPEVYDYNMAIDRLKLALYNAIVKNGKVSERAYICLLLSWVYRGMCDGQQPGENGEETELVKKGREEERKFYEEAFKGLTTAVEQENPPICGLDSNTLDILLAEMAFKLEKYDLASRFVGRVITSRSASRNVKDKAGDLKQEILQVMREQGTA